MNAAPNINAEHIEVAVGLLLDYRKNVIVPNVSWGFLDNREADIISVNANNYITEVEIKISVSDFKSDFSKNHDHGWQSGFTKYLYYAFPDAIFEKIEATNMLPDHAGVILVRWNGYRYQARRHKNAKANKNAKQISGQQLLKLAKLGCMRVWECKKQLAKKNKTKKINTANNQIKLLP